MIKERCATAFDSVTVADEVINHIASNGGDHLYEKYLETKDNPHCSYRLVQFFEEGI